MKSIILLLLAGIVGVELALGIIVAPVIFYPQSLIGEGVLSLFQSGLMMSVIFVKFGYVLVAISALSFAYEALNYRSDCSAFKLKFSRLLSALIVLVLSLIFAFYFTPYIIETQKLGEEATKSAEFVAMHSASEMVMKIILFFQIILYFLSFKTAKKL